MAVTGEDARPSGYVGRCFAFRLLKRGRRRCRNAVIRAAATRGSSAAIIGSFCPIRGGLAGCSSDWPLSGSPG